MIPYGDICVLQTAGSKITLKFWGFNAIGHRVVAEDAETALFARCTDLGVLGRIIEVRVKESLMLAITTRGIYLIDGDHGCKCLHWL